jgi:hypothetical protein
MTDILDMHPHQIPTPAHGRAVMEWQDITESHIGAPCKCGWSNPLPSESLRHEWQGERIAELEAQSPPQPTGER